MKYTSVYNVNIIQGECNKTKNKILKNNKNKIKYKKVHKKESKLTSK